MPLRVALIVGVLILTMSAVSPARLNAMGVTTPSIETVTDEKGRYAVSPSWSPWTISGIVWLDENQDGIRQTHEPVAPDRAIHADIVGHNYVTLISVSPKKDAANDGSPYFAYRGCAFVVTPKGVTGEVTVNIRAIEPPQRWSTPPPFDRPLADGHFFKQATLGRIIEKWCDSGFSVTNSDGIPFWDTWQTLSLENIGYPISHRFMWRGFVTQVFQKAIMQWQPGKGVIFVNILDELHDAGRDHVLRVYWAVPFPLDTSFDADLANENWNLPEEFRAALIMERRLALLDDNPAIKERYYAAPDPLLQYGLPTSRVEDMGNHFAIRTQRTVFQQWKEDVPWAKAGKVTIANVGEMARNAFRTCARWDEDGKRCMHPTLSANNAEYREHRSALLPQHIELVDQGTWQ